MGSVPWRDGPGLGLGGAARGGRGATRRGWVVRERQRRGAQACTREGVSQRWRVIGGGHSDILPVVGVLGERFDRGRRLQKKKESNKNGVTNGVKNRTCSFWPGPHGEASRAQPWAAPSTTHPSACLFPASPHPRPACPPRWRNGFPRSAASRASRCPRRQTRSAPWQGTRTPPAALPTSTWSPRMRPACGGRWRR